MSLILVSQIHLNSVEQFVEYPLQSNLSKHKTASFEKEAMRTQVAS